MQPDVCCPLQLPPEIWESVFSWLPRGAARNCLSVSRIFRDLAFRLLFRNVTICFGAWEAVEVKEYTYDPDPDAMDTLEDKMSAMSSAILHRISRDPAFAIVVHGLDIRAYKRDGSRSAFELGEYWSYHCPVPYGYRLMLLLWTPSASLVEAIHSLSNLRSFIWHGTSPSPTPEIVEALVSDCTMLQHFSAP